MIYDIADFEFGDEMKSRSVRLFLAAIIYASVPTEAARAGPRLLFDGTNGQALEAKDIEQPWFPASLTKLLTAYIVFDTWKSGKVARNSKITVSAKANSRPKTRLGIGAGKEITYDEAISALVLLSANDVAVALAEAVSGSEEAFVAGMNLTAARLGMFETHFINTNGLPGEDQYTTAKDLAMLVTALVRDFPEQFQIFSQQTAHIGAKQIATHNQLLTIVAGADGMKTVFTCSAGYNIIASAISPGFAHHPAASDAAIDPS